MLLRITGRLGVSTQSSVVQQVLPSPAQPPVDLSAPPPHSHIWTSIKFPPAQTPCGRLLGPERTPAWGSGKRVTTRLSHLAQVRRQVASVAVFQNVIASCCQTSPSCGQ